MTRYYWFHEETDIIDQIKEVLSLHAQCLSEVTLQFIKGKYDYNVCAMLSPTYQNLKLRSSKSLIFMLVVQTVKVSESIFSLKKSQPFGIPAHETCSEMISWQWNKLSTFATFSTHWLLLKWLSFSKHSVQVYMPDLKQSAVLCGIY